MGLGFISGFGFIRVLGFRVLGFRDPMQDSRISSCHVSLGFGFRVSGLGFRVSGLGFRV